MGWATVWVLVLARVPASVKVLGTVLARALVSESAQVSERVLAQASVTVWVWATGTE